MNQESTQSQYDSPEQGLGKGLGKGRRRQWLAPMLACLAAPGTCLICARATRPELDLCDHCEALWPRTVTADAHMCLGCGSRHPGVPVGLESGPESGRAPCCPVCRAHPGPWRQITAPYCFDWPVDQLMLRYKAGSEPVAARVFGTLLAQAAMHDAGRRCAGRSVEEPETLWILPMPMHPSRLRQRGFNQAAQLARWCVREWRRQQRRDPATHCAVEVVLRPRCAWRTERSAGVTGMSRGGRALEILGAFGASPQVAGRRIVIVDDVLTTGASAGELARELLDQGARSVDLWVVARTAAGSRG